MTMVWLHHIDPLIHILIRTFSFSLFFFWGGGGGGGGWEYYDVWTFNNIALFH